MLSASTVLHGIVGGVVTYFVVLLIAAVLALLKAYRGRGDDEQAH